MARRLAALVALVAILALALALLWRVYGHHVENGTFEESEPAVVEAGRSFQSENFARLES
ncbi:MAG: hypothetical protein WA208_10130 [Thermoanaerobaculia bacterium]